MAIKFTLFNNDWYADHINQTMAKLPEDASPDSKALAMAIMTGFAYVAESVTDSFKAEDRETIGDKLGNLCSTLYDIHCERSDCEVE